MAMNKRNHLGAFRKARERFVPAGFAFGGRVRRSSASRPPRAVNARSIR